MILSSHRLSLIRMIVVLGAMLLLAACSSKVQSTKLSDAASNMKFGTTVESYKSGQFELDGAILSPLDLGSHFAYLKDQGKLPKSVLLKRSDESKIEKRHLQYMARMAIDYGFAVYYDHKGEVRRIDPIAKNARSLDQGASKLVGPNGTQGQTAHDSTYGGVQQQEQRQQQQQQQGQH